MPCWKASAAVPQVVVGEDEFVELDEIGRSAPRCRRRPGGRPRPQAAVRRKPGRCGSQRLPKPLPGAPVEIAEAELDEPAVEGVKAGGKEAIGTACVAGRWPRWRCARRSALVSVTAESVRQLRERTGAGMMECKRALVETGGDLDAAAELMRKQGLAKADKKASRVAAEGVIATAASADGRAAVLVEDQLRDGFRRARR